MKKGTIIALVVAILLIIAGGTILMLGLSFAGNSEDPVTMLTESEHTITEEFDSILIDTEDCEVDFVAFEGTADPHVVIRQRENTGHSIRVENGTLKIQMQDNRNWRDFVGLGWENMEMTVYLPQKEYTSVRVTTATGHIQIPEVFQIQEAALRSDTGRIVCDANVTKTLSCLTATGGIAVRSAVAEIMTLESDTGRIHLSDATGTELHLENDTGRTEMENVNCTLLTCESETGDVTLRNVLAEDYLQVFTDTGDILIENSDAGQVNIETDTGDVSGNFLTSKWFQARSDTGRISVPNTREGGECRIETDTGDISFFYDGSQKIG